jgi:hypothetical protein
MSALRALAGRLRRGWEDVQRSAERAVWLGEKARTSGEDGFWDGVALNLHAFYTAAERLFEDIARTMDESLPQGERWHLDLLTQMSAEVKGVRPPVLRGETRELLDAFRGLRHVVRNVYAFNLRAARLDELLADLPACLERLREDLFAFIAFLEALEEER